ncbi:HD domain-containing protein [Solitalea sp. MAHUQ-68]|uniref:HD domain-containing protein n=1 Tax=Solitalea agri TaxID=2953739 RepID=A0A9X2F450_9SPHI|nr:HD domain-containing protein [Solitalea agri]MCO4293895.1 HD domain-containing protein [Solitalea agri]
MLAHTIIEEVLEENKLSLSADFNLYRNHVYRVFNLCLKLDNNSDNIDKYAVAAVFHDLGIWTNRTFDYLQPSVVAANEYLQGINKVDWQEEITLMIEMHHKISSYNGPFKKTVETFRQADWIDVTQGLMHFNLNRAAVSEIRAVFPNLGFHAFLLKQSSLNFLKYPLNPLPMFKK